MAVWATLDEQWHRKSVDQQAKHSSVKITYRLII